MVHAATAARGTELPNTRCVWQTDRGRKEQLQKYAPASMPCSDAPSGSRQMLIRNLDLFMRHRDAFLRVAMVVAVVAISACEETPNPPPPPPPPIHFTPHKFAGSAELHWQAPVANADNAAANRIDGFYIHYGADLQAPDRIIEIADPSATSFTVSDLAPGTYYFSVSAYGPNGEGRRSEPVRKTVAP